MNDRAEQEYKAFFASNDIKQVAANIKARVQEWKAFSLQYPITNPEFGIGEEYDVIGREEAHQQVARILETEGICSKKICSHLYVFYTSDCDKERLDIIIKDAGMHANWTDMVD